MEIAAFADGVFFKVGKATTELGAGAFESRVRVEFVEAAGVHESENHVPEFLFGTILRCSLLLI